MEMTIENRPADLIHENIDLAVRMDCPADQALIVRRIGFSRRILVAAPSYLARRGPVNACADLDGHDTIFTNASLSLRGTLMLHKGSEITELALSPKFTTNNAQILLDELMSGRGIGTAQMLLIANELNASDAAVAQAQTNLGSDTHPAREPCRCGQRSVSR